jgi:uncharacterized membrane protein
VTSMQPCPQARALSGGSVRGERGSVTTFVVVMVVPVVLMAALAFDGGRMLAARREAIDTAQNAALAGAQAIDGPAVRQGGVDVSPGRVAAASQEYLARNDATGTVSVGPNEVVVTVTDTVELTLLPMIGITTKTVTGTGRSELVRGVNEVDLPTGP